MVKNLALVGLFLSLSACGGLWPEAAGGGFNPAVYPKSATLAPSGTLEVNVWTSETSADSYFYTVDGGNANGTIVPDPTFGDKAIYTAPATPGNYVVRAGFTYNSGKTFTGIVSIKVQ